MKGWNRVEFQNNSTHEKDWDEEKLKLRESITNNNSKGEVLSVQYQEFYLLIVRQI